MFFTTSFVNSQVWIDNVPYGGDAIDDGIGFSIGETGYVGSGRDAGFQYRSDFYKYVNGQWEQIPSINGLPRQYTTSFSFTNTGCILTGLAPQDSLLNEIQCFADGNIEWHIKSTFPGQPRLQASSLSFGQIGYCGGGRNLQESLKDWYKFDFLQNSWSRISDFPDERHECVSFAINGKGYVGLGTNGQGTYFDDFYVYNPLTDTWSPVAVFPGNISTYATAFEINGKGYVCTGLDNSNNLSSEFWSYDPSNNSWTQLSDFPFPKIKGSSSFTVGNCGYIVTGIDENNVRKNINYSFCDYSENTSEILLYPNPSLGKIAIVAKGDITIEKISILNIQGKLILEKSNSDEYIQIETYGLSTGIYLVKILTSSHGEIIKKVVFE